MTEESKAEMNLFPSLAIGIPIADINNIITITSIIITVIITIIIIANAILNIEKQ